MAVSLENYIKQRDEHKQVSMTGARALVMFISFLEGPKTFEEIRQYLIDCGVVSREYSVDTIRIDINTLKAVGCQISKATKKNNHRYGLISHPFNLRLTSAEVDALKNVYKKVLKKASPQKILAYHKLFLKLANMTADEKIKEEILGISLLKYQNIEVLEELIYDDKKYNKVKILYRAPNNPDGCEYDITIEKIGVRHGKVYVFCYNHSLATRSFLNVSRIKSVISKFFDGSSTIGADINVKFKLKSVDEYELDENETIIENHNDYSLVEGKYFNKFIAMQRMLNFASDATVLEPEDVKEIVIEKLKEMRAVYE